MIRLEFFADNSVTVNGSRRIELKRTGFAILALLASRQGRAVSFQEMHRRLLWGAKIYDESALTRNARLGIIRALSAAVPHIDWEARLAVLHMYGYGLFLGSLSEIDKVRSSVPRRRVQLPSGEIVDRPVGLSIKNLNLLKPR